MRTEIATKIHHLDPIQFRRAPVIVYHRFQLENELLTQKGPRIGNGSMLPPLGIIIGKTRLTGMQKAALVARIGVRSHEEGAASIHITPTAFRWRFARAIAKLPYQARGRYRDLLPRRMPKPKPVQTHSLLGVVRE